MSNASAGLYLAESNQIEIVANRLGKNTTPAIVGYASRDRIVVGERANNCRHRIFDVKRLIGKPYAQAVKEGQMKDLDFSVSEAANGRC